MLDSPFVKLADYPPHMDFHHLHQQVTTRIGLHHAEAVTTSHGAS